MHRTLTFSINDLAADTKGVQDAVNAACSRRGTKYKLRGLVQMEDHVYFFLLPRDRDTAEEEYVLAPLDEVVTHEEMIGLISDRWAAGFDLVGAIDIYGTMFLVLARSQSRRKQA